MERLIEDAHGTASRAFDVAAAATASATGGGIAHMYEFGTAGITKGPVKFPDPTSQAARLWVHTLRGAGGSQEIGYDFRAALHRNPQPTTRDTGVPSKYLRRLSKRKYIFWNKARVMEHGMSVEIKSKQPHGLLFVPTPGMNAPRGFVMWNTNRKGAIRAVPGATVAGNFTALWMRWWGNEGAALVEGNMRKKVEADTRIAQREAERRAQAQPMKSATANNPVGAAAASRAVAFKTFGRTE